MAAAFVTQYVVIVVLQGRQRSVAARNTPVFPAAARILAGVVPVVACALPC